MVMKMEMKGKARREVAALVVALGLLLGGCAVNQEAALVRQEFALESERLLEDVAEAQEGLALHHIEQAAAREIERLQAVLEAQNARAGGDAGMVAQNYVDYYTAMEELRRRVADERAKVASLAAEQREIAGNFRALSSMADGELEQAAGGGTEGAVNAALRAAELAWQGYVAANPPALPAAQVNTVTVEGEVGE